MSADHAFERTAGSHSLATAAQGARETELTEARMSYPKSPVAVHVLLLRGDEALLIRRCNTGVRGRQAGRCRWPVESGEAVTQAALREAYEEVGMAPSRDRLRVVGVIHRRSREERVDFFLAYRLESHGEEPQNREPEKCSELLWATLASLPEDTVPYVRAGIESFKSGVWFQEFGWEAVWSSDAAQPTRALEARLGG